MTVITNIVIVNDLGIMLTKNQNLDTNTKNKVLQLKDLLEKMFILDPTKRITVGQALQHSFIIEKLI